MPVTNTELIRRSRATLRRQIRSSRLKSDSTGAFMQRTAFINRSAIAILALAIGMAACSSKPSNNSTTSTSSATSTTTTTVTTQASQAKVAPRTLVPVRIRPLRATSRRTGSPKPLCTEAIPARRPSICRSPMAGPMPEATPRPRRIGPSSTPARKPPNTHPASRRRCPNSSAMSTSRSFSTLPLAN